MCVQTLNRVLEQQHVIQTLNQKVDVMDAKNTAVSASLLALTVALEVSDKK